MNGARASSEQGSLRALQRRVQAVGVLALQRPARRSDLGVEAHAEERDVLRVLDEVLPGLGVRVDAGG